MSLFEPYRPRRPTHREQQQEAKLNEFKQKKQFQRKKRVKQQLEKRTSKLTYSEHNGIAYQDFTLGRSANGKTRTQLDRRVYEAVKTRLAETERPPLGSIPSLADCCLDLVAENYGEPKIYERLDSVHHLAHVEPLFKRIRTLADDSETPPYEVWLEFAARFGSDLPGRRRTYRGLVVGDIDELEALKDLNDDSASQFLHEPTFVPPFFLASLDLSNDKSFTDADVYKLRDPLSTFLAVLKLDGTSITDVGIEWIVRAASGDSSRYKHLELVSLQGLTKVTNEGIRKLSGLPNLRMIDLRGTGCNAKVVDLLSSSESIPFRHPRPRHEIRNTLIEFQLFGGSLSSSRTLASLHYLGKVQHSPSTTRYATIRSRPIKPLSIHISAMSRQSSDRTDTLLSTSIAPTGEKTAEQLYRDQLTLAGYAGSALATHHATFGALTSTVSLDRKLVEEDGRVATEKGAAFRGLIGDSVARGAFVGEKRVGGRTETLFGQGMRKLDPTPVSKRDWDPFSDTEDEVEKVEKVREAEREELKGWEAKSSRFYRGSKPVPRPERVIVAAEQSPFTLLRHLPYVEPYARREPAPFVATSIHNELDRSTSSKRNAVQEGVVLVKKKRRIETDTLPTPSSSSSSPSSFPISQFVPTSRPSQAPPRSNPFAKVTKKPAPSSARTDPKNIVTCRPTLASRSGLKAFKR